jgi:inosine-uridine nucleoside N-ribohydrolase
MVPVILDTDIGTDIDDTWALAMLLGCPELDLRLVTTVSGDTTYRARIAAGILAAGGRDDVPVGIGVARPLTGAADGAYPQRAFADEVDLARHAGGVHEDGVGALIETVLGSPEPVTVVAIGPATNLAAALEREPRIVENARLVGMHGSVHSAGPFGDEPIGEYNVIQDVEACRAALTAPWHVTLTPLDSCAWVVLRDEQYRAVEAHDTPLVRALYRNYREWLTPTEGDADVAALIDGLFEPADAQVPFGDRSSSILFDTVAVYLAYDESLLELEELPIELDDEGVMSLRPGARELHVATGWKDLAAFHRHLVERLSA